MDAAKQSVQIVKQTSSAIKAKQQDNVWADHPLSQEEIDAIIRSPHNQYYAYYKYAYTHECGEEKPKYVTDILFEAGQNAMMGFMMGLAREVKSQEGKLQDAGSNLGRYLQSKVNGYSYFITDPVVREQNNRREWDRLIDYSRQNSESPGALNFGIRLGTDAADGLFEIAIPYLAAGGLGGMVNNTLAKTPPIGGGNTVKIGISSDGTMIVTGTQNGLVEYPTAMDIADQVALITGLTAIASSGGGNSNNEGESKPSNKPYKNNKEANKQAQKQGYKDAHELKEDYVGKSNISKYDMKYDTKTGEIYLESKDGKTQIPTGLIHEP